MKVSIGQVLLQEFVHDDDIDRNTVADLLWAVLAANHGDDEAANVEIHCGGFQGCVYVTFICCKDSPMLPTIRDLCEVLKQLDTYKTQCEKNAIDVRVAYYEP